MTKYQYISIKLYIVCEDFLIKKAQHSVTIDEN